MFKLISMKTIGTTAVTLALLAGALITPAFAKGGYNNKWTTTSNKSVTERTSRSHRSLKGFKEIGLFDRHGSRY